MTNTRMRPLRRGLPHLALWSLLLAGPAGAAAQSGDAGPQAPPAESNIVEPELLGSPEARFPEAAFNAGIQADVIVQIDIGEDGKVSNPVPLEVAYYRYDAEGNLVEETGDVSLDPHGFIASANEAVRRYEFKPALLRDAEHPDGVPIPVRVTWKVGFVISEQEIQRQLTEADAARRAEQSATDPSAPVNFSGRVLERGVRDPQLGFRVRVRQTAPDSGLTAEAVTDAQGRFEFPGLAAGSWEVVVDEPGFRRFATVEEVTSTTLTDATFYIERATTGFVTRTTGEPPPKEVTRRILTVREVQRIPGNNNDAIKVVQNLPGVARSAFNGGQVIVRGSAPEDTGFFVDGMQLLQIYHFGGLRSVFPSELLSSVNFYPGAFSVQYGRATGGVIDVKTKSDRLDRYRGFLDTSFIDTGLYLEGPLGEKVDFQLGARRSYIDFILEPIAEQADLSFRTAPRYYDWQARVRYYPNERHTASLFVYGSDDLLDFVLPNEEDLPPDLRGGLRTFSNFQGAIARLDSRFEHNLSNSFQFQFQPQQQGFSLGEGFYFDLDVNFWNIRNTLEWAPSDNFALRLGTDPKLFTGDIRVRLPRPPKEGETPVDIEAAEPIVATESFDPAIYTAYLEADYKPTERLQLIPGARWEYYTRVARAALDGRIAARYRLTDDLVVKAAFGMHHQSPAPDESSTSFGNPNLRLESALHYVAGGEYALTPYLSVNVEGFYKTLDDLVTRTDAVRTAADGTERPLIYDNAAEGRVYGAEVFLRHQLANNFFGWLAYTVSRSERKDRPGEPWRLFDFDQTHILTVVGSYDLPRNWSVGLRWRYVTGSPDTPIETAVFDVDADAYVRVAPSTANESRNPDFHQLDVRVDKRWIYDTWTLNFYLDLQNAYNRANQEGINYQYDYEKSFPVSGIPIFPSFGLRGEF